MADEVFITAGQARELLGVSRDKLAKLIKEGALTAKGSSLDKRFKLVRRADVDKLLKETRPSPKSRVA